MSFSYHCEADPADANPSRARRRGRPLGPGTRPPDALGGLAQCDELALRLRRPSALPSICRTRSGVSPSSRPISRSGVGSPPPMP